MDYNYSILLIFFFDDPMHTLYNIVMKKTRSKPDARSLPKGKGRIVVTALVN